MGDVKIIVNSRGMVDVSKWQVSDIMQLPDAAFGPRWPISLFAVSPAAGANFDIAGLGCGDVFVIWDLWIYCGSGASVSEWLRLTMGQGLPATAAENMVNEDLLPEFGFFSVDRYYLYVRSPVDLRWPQLRMPIALNGRRVILQVGGDGVGNVKVWCGLVVSALPKEVPAWVFSDMANVR